MAVKPETEEAHNKKHSKIEKFQTRQIDGPETGQYQLSCPRQKHNNGTKRCPTVPSECRALDDDIHIVIRQYPRVIDSKFVKEEFDVFHSELLFLVVGELAFYCGHMSSLSLETCRAHISRVCCFVVCVDFSTSLLLDMWLSPLCAAHMSLCFTIGRT